MNTSPYITVKEAAKAAGRDVSRIYAWIREDRLTVREDADGISRVHINEVLELEAIMFKRKNNRATRRTTP